jgi:V/A-type H+/Na+-transporting ATPase subunit E
MNESIEQLANKIYEEGVSKAQIRAKEILDEAASKARKIVDDAEAKARYILENTERNAAELKAKYEAEMRISSRQAISALKQRVTELVIWELNHEPAQKAVRDIAFMQVLITKLMDYWLANFGEEDHLRILLPKDEYDEYRSYLKEKTAELLRSGITVEFTDSMRHGFQVEPVEHGFRISFTDEDFENYFSNFARPRVYKLLFGKDD